MLRETQQGWFWLNGKYAVHRDHKLWWARNLDTDLDITSLM